MTSVMESTEAVTADSGLAWSADIFGAHGGMGSRQPFCKPLYSMLRFFGQCGIAREQKSASDIGGQSSGQLCLLPPTANRHPQGALDFDVARMQQRLPRPCVAHSAPVARLGPRHQRAVAIRAGVSRWCSEFLRVERRRESGAHGDAVLQLHPSVGLHGGFLRFTFAEFAE